MKEVKCQIEDLYPKCPICGAEELHTHRIEVLDESGEKIELVLEF